MQVVPKGKYPKLWLRREEFNHLVPFPFATPMKLLQLEGWTGQNPMRGFISPHLREPKFLQVDHEGEDMRKEVPDFPIQIEPFLLI